MISRKGGNNTTCVSSGRRKGSRRSVVPQQINEYCANGWYGSAERDKDKTCMSSSLRKSSRWLCAQTKTLMQVAALDCLD